MILTHCWYADRIARHHQVEYKYGLRMIKEDVFLIKVSKTKADMKPFIEEALVHDEFRQILVKHLLHNDHINIYYHSYAILNKATIINPSLFYPYWIDFSKLLKYENSYHRNYGMDLIVNLMPVDKHNLFESIFDDFFDQLNHEKVSTRKYCIQHATSLIKWKPELTEVIVARMVESLKGYEGPEKHQNFLLKEFLNVLTSIETANWNTNEVRRFLRSALKATPSEKRKQTIAKVLNSLT